MTTATRPRRTRRETIKALVSEHGFAFAWAPDPADVDRHPDDAPYSEDEATDALDSFALCYGRRVSVGLHSTATPPDVALVAASPGVLAHLQASGASFRVIDDLTDRIRDEQTGDTFTLAYDGYDWFALALRGEFLSSERCQSL